MKPSSDFATLLHPAVRSLPTAARTHTIVGLDGVRIIVDGADAIVTALQMVASGVPVALLLPDQATRHATALHAPPRRLPPDAAQRALLLLERSDQRLDKHQLAAAADLFSVAKWPMVVDPGPSR